MRISVNGPESVIESEGNNSEARNYSFETAVAAKLSNSNLESKVNFLTNSDVEIQLNRKS